MSDALSHVGVNVPHPNHGKSAQHRQDGKNKPSDDQGEAGDDNGQSGDAPKGMSGTVADLKENRPADAGPLGQDVCVVASDGKCHAGDDHKGQGGDDSTPPSSGPDENNGGGQGNDDHGKPEVTPPAQTTTPNGSIETGEEHSDRDLPSGKGKPE